MGEMTRKEFLRKAAQAGLAAGVLSRLLPPVPAEAAPASTVALVNSSRAIQNDTVAAPVVREMVDKAVSLLTGKPAPQAWKSLFRPADLVAIKVNCISGTRMSSRPEVVQAVIAGLTGAGVKPENIYVYECRTRDLARGGYTINAEGPGPRFIGIDQDWDEQPTQEGTFKGRLARLLTEKATAIVNVPVLKDHDGVGVTFAMKNHYGSIANPGENHGDSGYPVAYLNAVPTIRSKTRLVVGDCIWGLADGGPTARKPKCIWPEGAVLVTTDPVAADAIAWKLLEAARARLGLQTLEQVGRYPHFIAKAAELGLGTDDPARIKVVRASV